MKKLLATIMAAIGLASGAGAATIDLSTVKAHMTIADGDVVTGSLSGEYRITIAAGATVKLKNAYIYGVDSPNCGWAGLTCEGDATIYVEDVNVVRGFHRNLPGIFVPVGNQLTITGTGTLMALNNGRAAGIGGGYGIACGSISIDAGTVIAVGGEGAAGIGAGGNDESGRTNACLQIKIGGSVIASGGAGAAGIGGGKGSWCHSVSVMYGNVEAMGGANAPGIGAGEGGTCVNFVFAGPLVNYVASTCGTGCRNAIGAGNAGSCGSIDINENLLRREDGRMLFLASKRLKLGAAPMDMTLLDGMTVSGTFTANRNKLSIAPGAKVTLSGVTINGDNHPDCKWAGLTCEGDATIILEGANIVKGFYEDYPGIFVPVENRLTIKGNGMLTALSNGYGAGIGAGYKISCGQIVIENGTVNAWGGKWAAGIGAGYKGGACTYVAVNGGTVNAWGGEGAAGIGTGNESHCLSIPIFSGTVSATGGKGAAGIGSGEGGNCYSSIRIEQYADRVTATCGEGCNNPIGAGKNGKAGDVYVAENLLDVTVGSTRTVTKQEVILNLLTENTTVFDGMTVFGVLNGNSKVSIADGATVTLSGITINGANSPNCPWAGLTCEGDATIIVEGQNIVRGFYEDYPGIYIPEGKTLTIKGKGSLEAKSNGWGAGIGGGYMLNCGNIVLDGGTIISEGGRFAAGIGSGMQASCGTIVVTDGITHVNAVRGDECNTYIGAGRGGSGGATTVASSLLDDTYDLSRVIRKADENWNGDLSALKDDVVALDGLQVYGTLSSNRKVYIADGATVTLSGATIDGSAFNNQNCPWAGLTCKGDATIVLKGSNTIKGFFQNYPGIYVPEGKTLTITGTGSLDASSSGYAAGIGAGNYLPCGNIVIEGGTIKASGGSDSAGIGGAGWGNCGDIAIRGGFVTAVGGSYAAGIGSGADAYCGTITIGSGIVRVVATCGDGCSNPIGRGDGGSGATVNLADGLSDTISGSTEVIEKGAPTTPDNPDPVAMAEFEEAGYVVNEGEAASIVVKGGNVNAASSVKVYLTYNTAAATDVDLAKGKVDNTTPKGGLKFPLTLEWAAGDTSPKTISIPVKTDKTIENNELLTLQLADASGMGLGDATVCNVFIHDPGYDELSAKIGAGTATKSETTTWNNLQKAHVPYIRGLADPADGGKVTGSGSCAEGKKVTLKATANKNFTFMGWFDEDGKIVAETASLVIDRTTKPAANTGTSTTITGVEADATYFARFKGDPQLHIGVVATDNTGAEPTGTGLGKYKAGTIAGMGRYAPGKKATAKATANKGYVFAGWYDGDTLVSLEANYPFEMVDEDTTLTAKFITSDEDRRGVEAIIDEAFLYNSDTPSYETSVPAGVYLEWPLAVTAHSKTTVAVSGLPAGLKFTAKDIMKKGSKTEVEIPANTIYGAPTAASKTERGTGNLVPSNVKITITTAGKNKLEFGLALTVTPLPKWMVGTFDGGGYRGQATLTIAESGKISGKYLSGGQTWTLSASSFDELNIIESWMYYDVTLLATAGRLSKTFQVRFYYDEEVGGIGEAEDADGNGEFTILQNRWTTEAMKAFGAAINGKTFEYDAVDLDENDGKVSLRFASTGKISAKCVFVTGKDPKTQKDITYSATGSAVLAGPRLPTEEEGVFRASVYIYFPPKSGKFAGYVSDFKLEWDGTKFERFD